VTPENITLKEFRRLYLH